MDSTNGVDCLKQKVPVLPAILAGIGSLAVVMTALGLQRPTKTTTLS